MKRTMTRIAAAMDDLEANWQETLADVNAGSIAAAVTLSYIDFRLGDLGWRNSRPKLADWHASFSQRASMVKTALPKP
jgi:glutathione S-transferase